ncbi:heterokaryon incompatibility protein-domain-containing protein [Xylaria scruposa]|nr:heterokaryon incompatibility protein-domain-containing protein [Xylaria scruposa]
MLQNRTSTREAAENATDLQNQATPSWKIDRDKLCSRCADSMRAALSVKRHSRVPLWMKLKHHETIARLEASAEIENCGICRIIVSTYPESEIETLPNGRDSRLCTCILWSDTDCCWALQIAATNGQHLLGDGAILYLFPADVSSKSSVFSSFTGDSETLGLAKSWFTKCCKSHNACQPKDPRTYPKRFLSIRPGEPIHLVMDSKLQLDHLSYATLSHCWGTACPLTLTTGSLSNFLSQIPETLLPKTFRDAINLARSFGFEYIWIDSLCIAQDDINEWQQESTKMDDIYQGSTLNISATGAKDGNVGLYFTRDSRAMQKIERIRIPYRSDTETEEHYLDVSAGDVYRDGIENSPLASRGWCLQERFLAPRTLHFAKSQIFWECQEIKCCETFSHGIPRFYRPSNFRPNVIHVFARGPAQDWVIESSRLGDNEIVAPAWQRFGTKTNRHVPKSLADIWAQYVSMYSRTKVTLQSDKLVAISGIARWIYRQTTQSGNTNVYLAGLWRENLQSQLLWRVVGPREDERREDQYHHTKPMQYLAPSWSWASTNKFIEYRAAFNVDDHDHPSDEWTTLIDIVEAKTELLIKQDNFGQVTGGALQIEFTYICSMNPRDATSDEYRLRRIYWDNDVGQEQTVYLLPILKCRKKWVVPNYTEGLVLKEVPNTSATPHFTRLGYFFIHSYRAKIGDDVEDLSRFKTRVNGKTCYCLSII